MAGATSFTRAAGATGVLLVPLAVLAFIAGASAARDPHDGVGGFVILAVLAAFGCAVVFTAGLLVRHRAEWWARPAANVLAVVLALGLFSLVTGLGGGVALAAAVGAVTFYLVLLGVLVVGALPRPATVIVLLFAYAVRVEGPPLLELATGLAALAGFVWLAIAMWDEEPGGYGPVRLWEGSVVEPAPPPR